MEGGWVVAWVMVVRRVGCGGGGVLVSFLISGFENIWTRQVKILKVIKAQEDQVGRTQGLEQGLPGIKAPLFLHGWVVRGFLGGWMMGWVVVQGGGGVRLWSGW